MKIRTLLFAALVPLAGCNTLKKLTDGAGSTPAAPVSLPDDYIMTGTTIVDFQVLEFPIQGRQLIIKIKKPGAAEFRTLYKDKYAAEYKVTSGPPSDALWFRREVVVNGNSYSFPGPVAPVGTQYEIRSISLATQHALY